MQKSAYSRLAAMTVIHFVAMYILMYAMVNSIANVYHNLNQVFMAALMTASMVMVEVPLMRAMYASQRRNVLIVAAAVVALALSFLMIRQQTAIGDTQFLRSMIPHHAGAILMCNEAPIDDGEIKELCGTIIASQQREIDQMNAILGRLAANAE